MAALNKVGFVCLILNSPLPSLCMSKYKDPCFKTRNLYFNVRPLLNCFFMWQMFLTVRFLTKLINRAHKDEKGQEDGVNGLFSLLFHRFTPFPQRAWLTTLIILHDYIFSLSRVVRADCVPAWKDNLHFNHVELVGLKIPKGGPRNEKKIMKLNILLDLRNAEIYPILLVAEYFLDSISEALCWGSFWKT